MEALEVVKKPKVADFVVKSRVEDRLIFGLLY